jgi:hypothetical protein
MDLYKSRILVVRSFLFLSIMFFGLTQTLLAQTLPYQHYTERDENQDSSSLQSIFRRGNFYGHARSFVSVTDNADDLSDYYAHAFGMGIGYESGKIKNFQIGISGFFIYNLYSSDLGKIDPLGAGPSRYELGLFDMENPNNHSDLDRLEDLYVKYNYRQSNLKVGKQHIRTPFINPQDGRMRPTLVDGLVLSFSEIKNTKIDAGYIYKISPRSTVKWFGVGESIGVYASGVNPDGTRSNYAGNLYSEGAFYAGITHTLKKNHEWQVWNLFVQNIFNASLGQYIGTFKLNNQSNVKVGLQGIMQQALAEGGHADVQKTYMQKDSRTYTYGARLELNKERLGMLQFNYNRITPHGRYLMPREWGRDPFFTFMPRERNEGFADVHAVTAVVGKSYGKSGFKSDVSYGRFYLPDVKDAPMNKYAMPSYWQFNADLRYKAHGFFKGFELQLLYVYKGQLKDNFKNNRYVFNRVDMSLYNFVINYHF